MKSIFGKKDGKASSAGNPSLPKPPTTREIFEDIENIKKNDPILSLASVLDTTGRHSLVDTDLFEYIDALKRRKRRESASSISKEKVSKDSVIKRKFSRTRTDSSGNDIPPSPSYISPHETAALSSNQDSPAKSTMSAEDELNQAQLDYDQIKHFLTTLEHSEEVTDAIDSEFVRLFKDIDKLSVA